MRSLPALVAALCLAAGTAFAQVQPPREPDQVVLELNAEAWAETETATVRAQVEAAFPGAQSQSVRDQVLAALAKTAPDAKWFLTRFDQVNDGAGLERWRVSAETRLPEAKLAGIRTRADQASKPGLKLAIAQIDFTPTLPEREATLSKLREQLYAEVKAELARLNGLYADRKYRVRTIDFSNGAGPVQPMQRMTMAASAPMDKAQEAISVSQKLFVRAGVVLAAE
jgi:hypothetical protein